MSRADIRPLYRVNYGNGQASGRMSERDARQLLAAVQADGYAYIQKDVGIDAPDGWIRWDSTKA